MEFVDNAEKLEVYTITHCAKFPKKYTFTLSNEIVGYTREIYNNVCSANEYPNSIEDYKRRSKLFAHTVELLKKVVRQLRIADQIFGIKATVMKDWMDLIDKGYLKRCKLEIEKLCRKYGIILNIKKTQIVKLSHGFTWLKTKFNILPSNRILKRLVRKSIRIMRNKLKKFKKFCKEGRMSVHDVYMSFQSWRAYAKNFNAHNSIQQLETLFYKLYGVTSKEAVSLN